MSQNYYEILEVRQNATDASIRRAVQNAKDRIAADAALTPLAREARFAELNRLADVLCTPAKRDHYDAALALHNGPAANGIKALLNSKAVWIALLAIGAISSGFYWQYDRVQTGQRIEREQIAAGQAEERRAKENEARRVQEKQRLLDELRGQRDADDKSRQESNEIHSAESQKKQYVADDRPALQPSNNPSSYESSRRDYEDRRQMGAEAWQRANAERKQQIEEELSLRRAKAEVDRQKRYLEQLEREEQYAKERREAGGRAGR